MFVDSAGCVGLNGELGCCDATVISHLFGFAQVVQPPPTRPVRARLSFACALYGASCTCALQTASAFADPPSPMA
jgi:hypothetical protein